MRIAPLLSLVSSAALVAACGVEAPRAVEHEETATRGAAVPERDLTLQAPAAPAVEVASPVELSRPRSEPKSASRARPKPAPAPAHAPKPQPPAEPVAEPVVVPAAEPLPLALERPPVAAEPREESESSGRELAPGKTVTVIPVSNGPVVEADTDDSWLPSERPRGIITRGAGGTCRRGGVRGIGIAGRIPVGLPARRLR